MRSTDLRSRNRLPTLADGTARSEFERAVRSGTLSAPPTAASPPSQPKQHRDFHQTERKLTTSRSRANARAKKKWFNLNPEVEGSIFQSR